MNFDQYEPGRLSTLRKPPFEFCDPMLFEHCLVSDDRCAAVYGHEDTRLAEQAWRCRERQTYSRVRAYGRYLPRVLEGEEPC